MTAEEVCTQIINYFGFLVVGTFSEYVIGSEVTDLVVLQKGGDTDRLRYPFRVVGEANQDDYGRQFEFACEIMKSYETPATFTHYYKVATD